MRLLVVPQEWQQTGSCWDRELVELDPSETAHSMSETAWKERMQCKARRASTGLLPSCHNCWI